MTAPDWTDPLGPCPFPSGTPPRVHWAPTGMSPDRLECWGAVAASRCWCMPCPSCGEDWCALLPDGSPDGYRLAAEIGCSASCEPPAMAWWHAWHNGDLPARAPPDERAGRYATGAIQRTLAEPPAKWVRMPRRPAVTEPCLEADRAAISGYIDALFRHAEEGSYVSLRTFEHEKGKPPVEIRPVEINGEGLAPVIAQATGAATRAARNPKPVVFAPPVCTFANARGAAERDVRNGVALSVESDEWPDEARRVLPGILGPATVTVVSGGLWANPETGEVEPKAHQHWRLKEPTRTAEERAKLKRARKLAAALVKGDLSAASPAHPLRCPGSWHRKAKPKLCRIAELRKEVEIDLGDAVERLEQAVALRLEHATGEEARRLREALDTRADGRAEPWGGRAHDPEARDPDLEALADALPNEDAPRSEWNNVGMAFYAASDGSGAGFNAWDRWSRKSKKKYHGGTVKRWEGMRKSPPTSTGIGALVNRAKRVDPGFRLPSYGPDPGGPDDDPTPWGDEDIWDEPPPAEDDEPPPDDTEEPPPNGEEGPRVKRGDKFPRRHKDGRLLVYLTEARVNKNAEKCARLLFNEIFLRGPEPAALVRVAEVAAGDDGGPEVAITGVRHDRDSLILTQPSPERAQHRLDAKVLFKKFDSRSGVWGDKACPRAFAARLLGAACELGFRQCSGIVAVPLFRSGAIVAAPGYHAATGCYLDLRGEPPAVPSAPTKTDAAAALEVILAPFAGYVEGHEEAAREKLRCAFAAAALTAILRPSLDTAPAILLDANVPGAGKGKAARALAVIATGRRPAIITEGHDDKETEKRLASAVLSGAPALLLDNLQNTLMSSTLESGLTEGHATIRIFGKLVDVTVPCSALVLITANNAGLRADMLRRTLPVRIVVDTDKPELRQFGFDPYELAKCKRPEIVAAALTIARAWWLALEAGEKPRKTLGSFEQWARLVAGAVEWLTGANPVELIEERKAEDPAIGAERRVIEELHALFCEREWTARDAVGAPPEFDGSGGTGLDPDTWAGVLSFRGARPTPHAVGVWLRDRRDTVFLDLKLIMRLDRKGVAIWRLAKRGGRAQGDL